MDKLKPPPGLYIVSTPIGNLKDITLRALNILGSVDEILAEDTRTAAKLLTAHNIKARITPYHDHNGMKRRPDILKRLAEGQSFALISDAGTPLVSDPGWKLVEAALEAGLSIIPMPGASALLAALVVSGLPSDRFAFVGFLPVKSAARRKVLTEYKALRSTLIFYEAGPRLASSLADMCDILGADRRAAVARELTKMFEETRRDRLGELAKYYADTPRPKGEIVVLVGPAEEKASLNLEDLRAEIRMALLEKPVKIVAQELAAHYDLPKRSIYQMALEIKNEA